MALLSGSLFANRFEIDRTAGSGGMGTVYRARDRYSGEVVALKLLHNVSSAGHEAERFLREAQLLGELHHAGIVSHIAHGQTPNGQLFLAMEWLDGEDLSSRLRRGPLSIADSITLIRHIAAALAKAHQRSIIHRDLKPANLFLQDGVIAGVKVLDFGIARRAANTLAVTGTGLVIGTPEYMSPEQARGQRDILPAADIFSLGCVLYECLTGQPPFVADHIAAVLVRILFDEPRPLIERRPTVPPNVAALVRRMLAKDVADRPRDATVLCAELEALGTLAQDSGSHRALASAVTQGISDSFAQEELDLTCVVLAAPPAHIEDTESAATLPPKEAQDELTRRESIEGALSLLGARLEWLLDGTLVVTLRSTGTAVDQAALAARAALRIKQHWPEAQIALATGRGSVQGSMPVGEAAERATALLRKHQTSPTSKKRVSGVWLDTLSARLLDRQFEVANQSGETLLIGEAPEVEEARLLLGKSIPCLGRDSELATLEAQARSCIEDSAGRAVLLTGPPGMGKSRLRNEFLRRIRQNEQQLTVVEGRGEIMHAGSPYAILGKALRRLCELSGAETADVQGQQMRERLIRHLPPAETDSIVEFLGEMCGLTTTLHPSAALEAARQDPKLMRDHIHRAFVEWLYAECAANPVILLLDDFQWADGLTVALIDEVLRELANRSLYILVLARPEVRQVFPSLWPGHALQEIKLPALSKRACERLIQLSLGTKSTPELEAHLCERSGGNALFLEELLRAVAQGEEAGSSETVLAMLQSRLGRLPTEARRALRAASIMGQTFWLGYVGEVIGADRESPELARGLRALVEAEVITPQRASQLSGEKEYTFRHALMRDAAYSLLSVEDARLGHQRAAEFLERHGSPDPMVLAEHWQAAKLPASALPYFIQAAMKSFLRSDVIAAISRAERGLECGATGEQLGALRAIQGLAFSFSGNIEKALPAIDDALKYCPVAGTFWCWASMLEISFFIMSGRWDELPALVGRYLATQPTEDAIPAYASGIGNVGSVFAQIGMGREAGLFLDRLEEIGAQVPHEIMVQNWRTWGKALLLDVRGKGFWEVLAAAQRADQAFARVSDWHMLGWTRTLCLPLALEIGTPDVFKQFQDSIAMAQRHAQHLAGGWLGGLYSWYLAADLTTCGEGIQLAKGLLAAGVMPPLPAKAHTDLARAALILGDLDQAEKEALTAQKLAEQIPAFRTPAEYVYIEVLLAQQRPAEAVLAAQNALEHAAPNSSLANMIIGIRIGLARAQDALGNRDQAKESLQVALGAITKLADQAPDAAQRAQYLDRISEIKLARRLARDWLGIDPFI